MMAQLEQLDQGHPREVLADGGCVSLDDFDPVQQKQTVV